jgi:ribosomal protein S14
MNNNIITQKNQNRRLHRPRSTGRPASTATRANHARPVVVPSAIKNGSLYSYRGQTVRAIQICTNGLRLVASHGSLFGFVKDNDLKKINGEEVKNYLNF